MHIPLACISAFDRLQYITHTGRRQLARKLRYNRAVGPHVPRTIFQRQARETNGQGESTEARDMKQRTT